MLFPKASQPVVITPSPATKPSPTGMESSWRHFLQAYKNRNLQEIDTTFHRLLADSGYSLLDCTVGACCDVEQIFRPVFQ
jgi:hypothetical protein